MSSGSVWMLTSLKVNACSARRSANAKLGDQRRPVQQRRIDGHRVDLAAIDLDAGRVEDEGVLLLAAGAALARADDEVVVPPAGVEHFAELPQELVVLGANFLDRHDVEAADDVGQDSRHRRVAELLFAEDLNVVGRDADRAAGSSDRGTVGERAAGWRGRFGPHVDSVPAVDPIVLGKVPAAGDERGEEQEVSCAFWHLAPPWARAMRSRHARCRLWACRDASGCGC